MEKQLSRYGSWQSSITAEQVAKGTLKFSEIKLDGSTVYWLERNPADAGRTTIKSWNANEGEKEILPREYSVRSKVHEYGGGAFLFDTTQIYFVNESDQQIYSLDKIRNVKKITDAQQGRFADGCIHPDGSLFYVMESHVGAVANSIVHIDPGTGDITTIASGYDFYSSPRVSPEGNQLAYVCWNHPNMPWDGTELWIHNLNTLQKQKIAGGQSESIHDPQWSPEGQLYYISDRSGWWNIYSQGDALWNLEAEFTLPPWVFGRSLRGFSKEGIFGSYVKNGSHGFYSLDPIEGKAQIISLPFTDVDEVVVNGESVAFIASSVADPCSIILYDLRNHSFKTIKRCCYEVVSDEYISKPFAIDYPSNNRMAHAFYYPPQNPQFCGLANEKPPLIVNVHGGPTGHISPGYSAEIFFWTSRGFAYLDVNYGGSTGYGREYRDSLKGQWGIVDVADCINGALYCEAEGLADINRLTIMGASAGGYTVLAAVAASDLFKAGADYFGVSDLEMLALDTHKFESRYLESIVAPYPQQREIYEKRSPISNIEKINTPVIIFQGDMDMVVPPSQSEIMFKSLSERKIPAAYHLFAGEGHGFRKSETLQSCLEEQLSFFLKHIQ